MKSCVFASPQLHQRAAGIGLLNDLVRLDQISNERDVAAVAKYRSVRELRIARRANHDARKFTTPRKREVQLLRRRAFHNLPHNFPPPPFIPRRNTNSWLLPRIL